MGISWKTPLPPSPTLSPLPIAPLSPPHTHPDLDGDLLEDVLPRDVGITQVLGGQPPLLEQRDEGLLQPDGLESQTASARPLQGGGG